MSRAPAFGQRARHRRSSKRHLIAAGLAVWALGAILLPLSVTLPPALRTGTAVRRLHGQSGELGAGWEDKIQHALPKGGSRAPLAWEQSRRATVTITVAPGRSLVWLELDPTGCRDGIEDLGLLGPTVSEHDTLLLRHGFHWYSIGLARAPFARSLTLSAHCTPGAGHDRSIAPVGIAIAGLSWPGSS